MRFIRTALLSMSVACCAISGIAQDQHWRGKIPFSFKIKNHIFPEGVYDIDIDANHGVVNLSNTLHPGEHMHWIGIPSDRQSLATMRFAVNGDSYTLTSVAAGNWMTRPQHLPDNVQEATLAFPR